MKTHTITTYTATELKEQFPDAFEKALDRYSNTLNEIHWQSEIFDSLKAICEAAGVKLRDWDLGLCNRSNGIKISFPHDDCEEISGKRAFAWLENNLFGPLRVPWIGKKRLELRQHGSSYYAGKVPPCPLTGVCFDEDYLDALRKNVSQGQTLKDAFKGLADTYVELLEVEYRHQGSEEYFIEHAEANGWQFTENGEQFE